MRGLPSDVTYFGRSVAKSPGFFAVAVVTIALGIGATTAIFSVINAVLLRPLPFHDPDRLVRLFETEAAPGRYPFAAPDYLDWKAQNTTLASSALYAWNTRVNVSGQGQPESALLEAAEVTFFDVLGVRPLLGRTFVRADGNDAGPGAVAVLSYGFWQRHFGGNPGVLNRQVELDARRFTVVGVMPAWFNYPRGVDVWTPLDMSPTSIGPRGSHSFQAIARLKPGVTVSGAQADLALIAKRLEQQFPDSNEKVGAAVVSMKEQMTGRSREPLLILLGAVVLVQLVACANVANLLLIRAGNRQRELAVRAALGAGRRRIFRQLLTESVLLALTGGSVGLAVAWWAVRVLRSIATLPIPASNPIAVDVPVFLFAFGTAVVTGLVFGLFPAIHASRASLADELRSAGKESAATGTRANRLRDVIAVAEIGLSLALLVGAGLLLRSFDKMRHADIGVDTENVLTLGVSLPESRYGSLATKRAFLDRLLARVRATPGVRTAALATRIPPEGGSNGFITVPGLDNSPFKEQLFEWNYVTRDYIQAFRIPVLRGRDFTQHDEDQAAATAEAVSRIRAASPADVSEIAGLEWPAMINKTMARLIWSDQDPLGRTFIMGGVIAAKVVAVVGDVKATGLRDAVPPQAYLAFPGSLRGNSNRILVVKSDRDPAALLPAIRAHLNSLDPTLAVVNPRTMDDVISDGMADTSMQTWLIGIFAMVAAVLAAVGLYSVMAFLVAQRGHELGVRVALGAAPADLAQHVMGRAARLVAIGLAAGLASALWLTRLMRSLLFGVAANDLATFVGVAALLALVAAVACAVPTRRAMRVDPIVALRQD
jgi:predicted permease